MEKPAPAPPPRPAPLPAPRPLVAAPRPVSAAGVEGEETPLWRGVKMGIGFMLAVVSILLLLALVLFWLSNQPGWKPWFDRLLP